MAETTVGAARPRVLVIEDDAALRQLVTMALEELPIDLLCCPSVEAALPQLQGPPFALVITDLMMPGITGLDLLQRLVDEPALRAGARLVAFSAGLDAAMRRRLQALGVWRMLGKPVSLQELEDCVNDALAAGPEAVLGQGAAGAADATAAPGVAAGAAAAIAQHFGGDAALFHAFRATCLSQFVNDVREGDAALAAADAPALRRLGHSLKSVLATLGHEDLAALAHGLETTALQGAGPALPPAWAAVRAALRALAEDAAR